jgi:hypothetical protein
VLFAFEKSNHPWYGTYPLVFAMTLIAPSQIVEINLLLQITQ